MLTSSFADLVSSKSTATQLALLGCSASFFFAAEWLFSTRPVRSALKNFYLSWNPSLSDASVITPPAPSSTPPTTTTTSLSASKKKSDEKQMDLILRGSAIRIVCALHNFPAIIMAAMCLLDAKLQKDIIYATSPTSSAMILFSAGFFVWDSYVSILDLLRKEGGMDFVFHGLACGSLYLYSHLSRLHHWPGAGFLLWECSTPFLHLRWLLYNMGLGKSGYYAANGLVLYVVFFLCRIVWGWKLSWIYLIRSNALLAGPDKLLPMPRWLIHFFRVANVALNSLNSYWFWLMTKKILAVVMPPKKKEKEDKKSE